MIKLENTEVFGWEAAIRGMRNPMNSWDKSDSTWVIVDEEYDLTRVRYQIGDNDLKLMKSLSKAGTDHSKFLRMINVTVDVTAPLYWWKEYDTYKIGTVANSCSTMHKIHTKYLTLDDFSCEHLLNGYKGELFIRSKGILLDIIDHLNWMQEMYLETKDKELWWQIIQLLPTSYNQKRTIQLNYQVLKSMYHARKNHKLDEWVDFCKWCETLPYFSEICINN